MKNFDRLNKTTGIRWLKGQVEDINIRIHLKPAISISSIPKFKDYANDPSSFDLQTLQQDRVEEFTFKWQEKVFSKWECTRYSDIHNCINDIELEYNKLIEDNEYEPSEVFSYIHEDYYLPVPSVKGKKENNNEDFLSKCMEKLKVGNTFGKYAESASSMRHLFKSEENLDADEEWKAMHIVLDSSEYNETSQLIVKKESVLLSLYHNTNHNYLIISPENNDLELNPYEAESESCQYAVDVDFGETEIGEELLLFLQKLNKRRERRLRQIMPFVTPPLGRKRCSFVLEILTADCFHMNDLYVQYEIKVPETISCDDVLKGRTHTSRLIRLDGKQEWDFGQMVELNMEMDDEKTPFVLQMFFEIISVDWWSRHRTEGYCYLPLTLRPGCYSKQLSCSRPQEKDTVEAESRRFFVGGCNLLKDVDVLAKPYLMDDNIVFKTTGNLNLRWSTIIQYSTPTIQAPSTPGPSSASVLLQGAEAALRQYRKARARLAAATKDLKYQESIC